MLGGYKNACYAKKYGNNREVLGLVKGLYVKGLKGFKGLKGLKGFTRNPKKKKFLADLSTR